MLRMKVAQALKSGQAGQAVDLRGWVRTRRDSKQAFSFVELNDGSCLANLQIVIDANVPGYAESIKQVTTGASIAVEGEIKDSPAKGQRIEVHAKTLRVLGEADPLKYPLQKKGHSMEFLRKMRTCVREPTRSERSRAFATRPRRRFISSFSRAGLSTSSHRSSQPATVKVPDKCFK